MMQTNKHLRLHFHCVELLSHQFKWTSEHFTQVTLTANNEYVMILMQHSEHNVHTVVLNVGWSSLPTVTPDALHSSVLLWTTPFIYCCFCLRDVKDLPHYMCATRNVSASLQTLTWWRCVSCDPQSTHEEEMSLINSLLEVWNTLKQTKSHSCQSSHNISVLNCHWWNFISSMNRFRLVAAENCP